MTEQAIWNILYDKIQNPYGTASLMGIIKLKSNFNPKAASFPSPNSSGYIESTYYIGVNNNTNISFSTDNIPFGIFQWQASKHKQQLLEYTKKQHVAIEDLKSQLLFLCDFLNENMHDKYQALKNTSKILTFSFSSKEKIEELEYSNSFLKQFYTIQKEDSMSVLICHIPIDELGKPTGGTPGVKENNTLTTRKWYNKQWVKVFRPVSSEQAEDLVKIVQLLCDSKKIHFNADNRFDLFAKLKSLKWDLTKIEEDCFTDSTAFISVICNLIGIQMPKDVSSYNLEKNIHKTNKFLTLSDKKILTNSDYLKQGDILLGKNHAAIVLNNGAKIKTSFKTNEKNTSFKNQSIGTARALQNKIKVRNGAGENFKVLKTISRGTALEVLGITGNNWYKIVWPSTDSGYAYVSNEKNKYFSYIPKPDAPINNLLPNYVNYYVIIKPDVINVHSGPDIKYQTVGCIKKHGLHLIIQEQGNWGLLQSGLGWIDLTKTSTIQ